MNKFSFNKLCYLLVVLLIPTIFFIHIAQVSLTNINSHFANSTLNIETFNTVFAASVKEITTYYGLYIILIVINYIVASLGKNKLLLILTILEVAGVGLFTYPFEIWQQAALLIIPAFANIFLYVDNT